ncbi:MAG: hypothetical protein HDKAJFGB_01677 [Anaerolineae bacterium]|nr:hypothetical protein [Anaerolineae bacterium]
MLPLVGGAKILTDGEQIYVVRAQIAHRFQHFVGRFAKAEQNRTFGFARRVELFDRAQNVQSLVVSRAAVAHSVREAAHRFDILRDDFGLRVHNFFHLQRVAAKIGRQDFDDGARRAFFDFAHGLGKDARAAVRQIVAVHARNDDVIQIQFRQRFAHAARFVHVHHAARIARFHRAKAARARTRVAENHNRQRTRAPTFADVGTARFAANGIQFERADEPFEPRVLFAERRAHANPFGMASGRRGH